MLISRCPLATKFVPVSATTFMHVIGVVEIIAGLIVLSRWTKLGSYIVMFWLLGITVCLQCVRSSKQARKRYNDVAEIVAKHRWPDTIRAFAYPS